MRFLDLLDEGYSNRGVGRAAAGTGQASDFTNRFNTWIGYNLQFNGSDPILKEHFAAWWAKQLEMDDPDAFVAKVRNKKFVRNDSKPKFQQRHYWFIAYALKTISNQWMWEYGFEFFSKNCTSEGFSTDIFRREAKPKVFGES